MKISLNILHYCLYLIQVKLHLLFNKINPVLLLFKIPSVKKRMKESDGIESPTEWYNNFWNDKKNGFGTRFIGGSLIGIISFAFIGLGIILVKIISPELVLNSFFFISMGIISYLICYFLVFKNDQYLEYFNEFEDWTIKQKRKYVFGSISFILLIIVLFFFSLLGFN
ncbi:hypothetical protein ACFFVB_12800 [Formosa undariae]|uniref:Uncharacterized protein n=1 Tax=Formosa undariae TaxID=1325436 RepID=A0ABV5F3D9_9FLAO